MNATKDKFFSIISHDLKNPSMAQQQALKSIVDNFNLIDEKILRSQAVRLSSRALKELEQVLLLMYSKKVCRIS